MNRRVRWTVTGLVQGVGYRAAIQREAEKLILAGWVRNLNDGRVEILAEGQDSAVGELMAFSRHGPPGATVSALHFADETPEDMPAGFTIRSTI